jgi:hypothetical protein
LSVVEDTTAPPTSISPTPIPVKIGAPRGGPPRSRILRTDKWWLQPASVAFGLLAFVVDGTWTAFRDANYYAGPTLKGGGRNYLSPFYSPCITTHCVSGASQFGHAFSLGSLSPALVILIFPMGFRLTCYYYRKAYYRSFWLSPPACAVADAGSTGTGLRSKYGGETRFPLILNNIHRYFFYFALALGVVLTWDAIQAFRFVGGIGMGLGTLIFIVNAVLIWCYTLGCHACRHLCGGGAKLFSKSKIRFKLWNDLVTPLNKHHQLFAWLSLVWIAGTDFYVWLVASGTIHDPRFF